MFCGNYEWNCCLNFCFSLIWFVYRKATEFCVLVLSSASVLKVFIRSNNWFLEYFRFLMYKSILSENGGVLTLYSHIYVLFVSFGSFMVVAETSSTMLKGVKRM